MWVRMARFRLKPEAATEAVRAYEEHGVPRVRAFRGNAGCYLLEEIGSPAAFLACTFWKTEEDVKAYESSGVAQEVAGLLRNAFAGPPELKSYRSVDAA